MPDPDNIQKGSPEFMRVVEAGVGAGLEEADREELGLTEGGVYRILYEALPDMLDALVGTLLSDEALDAAAEVWDHAPDGNERKWARDGIEAALRVAREAPEAMTTSMSQMGTSSLAHHTLRDALAPTGGDSVSDHDSDPDVDSDWTWNELEDFAREQIAKAKRLREAVIGAEAALLDECSTLAKHEPLAATRIASIARRLAESREGEPDA